MADFIDEIIAEEGGSKLTDDPADSGGRTIYGISERANPDLWLNGPPTREQARECYRQRYIVKPGFDKISFLPLQHQVADFGVTSGPERATNTLQAILGVERDGVIGPITLAALASRDAREVNNLYAAAREQFYYHLALVRPKDKRFLKGWLKRAQRFYLP
jgi:lysozyme family protein